MSGLHGEECVCDDCMVLDEAMDRACTHGADFEARIRASESERIAADFEAKCNGTDDDPCSDECMCLHCHVAMFIRARGGGK